MLLNERLKILKENKIKEKETLLRIKHRKFIEALENINSQIDLGLHFDETIFNCDISSEKIARYLGFKPLSVGFTNVSFKITKRGLKNLDKILIKYKIGENNNE